MRYIPFLVPLLLAGGVLRAQPENLLLSPDPVLPVLPEEIRIQSAAVIDQTAFVVWGSTREEPAGEIRNVLYGRIVRDGQPVGSPEIVVAPDAVPFDFVMVLSAGDRFRMLWSDRRGGVERIYRRDIDMEGRPIGEESLVAEGREKMVRKVQGLEGAWMIELSKGGPVFIHADGSIDRRRVNPRYISSPSVSTADSSLVLIYGDSIYTYPTLFDTIPVNVAHYAREDSTLKETEVLLIDSAGRYRLFFVTAGAPEVFSYFLEDVQFRFVSKTLSPESGELEERKEVLLERIFVGAGASLSVSSGYQATPAIKTCEGDCRFSISAFTREKFPNQPLETREYLWYYGVDLRGELRRISVSEYNGIACVDAGDIVRNDCPSTSCVRFNGTDLEAPVVLQEVVAQHTFPRLIREGDFLYISWIDSPGRLLLHHWSLPTTAPVFLSQYVGSLSDSKGKVQTVAVHADKGIAVGYTETVKAYNYQWGSWMIDWEFNLQVPLRGKWIRFVNEEGLYADGAPGLHERYLLAASGDVETENLLTGVRDTGLNNRLTLYDPDLKPIWRVFYETSSPDDLDYLRIAPLGEDKYIDISNRGLARIIDTNGNVLREASFDEWLPASSGLVRLQETWSLVYHLPHDGLPLRLRIYDENFLMPARWEGEVDSLTGLAVAQNREDGSIAVVASTAAGTRLTMLDGGLRPLRSARGDTLVNVRLSDVPASSRNPAALFRNDTLIVVWEDYRGKNPDIYGAYFRPVDYVSGVVEEPVPGPPAGSEPFGVSVRPNPADRELLLDIVGTSAESVRVELVDMLGRKVLALSHSGPGGLAGPIRINLEELPSGAYLLNVSSAGASVSEPVLVRHSSSH